MSFEGRHAYLYLLAIAVVLGLIGVIVTNQEGSGTPAAAYSFGTLVSETAHAAQESKKGIRVAMVELSWRRYEPQPGHWDSQYIRSVHDEVEGQERAGRRVTLGLGLQSPPAWLYDVPNSRLIDQRGQQSAEINLI